MMYNKDIDTGEKLALYHFNNDRTNVKNSISLELYRKGVKMTLWSDNNPYSNEFWYDKQGDDDYKVIINNYDTADPDLVDPDFCIPIVENDLREYFGILHLNSVLDQILGYGKLYSDKETQ